MSSARCLRQSFPLDMIAVDRTSEMSLHRQLHRALVKMIQDRTLAAGTALPSTRELAADLALARNTIIAAYDQLVTEGYLVNRQGARYVVVDLPLLPKLQTPSLIIPSERTLSVRGMALMHQPFHHGSPGCFAFHPGMPDAHNFPFGVWGRLLARRASFAGDSLFGTYHVTGLPELKEAIVGYLASSRGVICTKEQIVITTGAQAAFDLLARLLLDPGDRVWMEEPGYYGAKAAFTVAGADVRPMPVTLEGWQMGRPPKNIRLIYVTPACQHPLGTSMRMDQRLQLLELAERSNAWIIEDDFDGEYRFQGRPVPAVHGMDRSGNVIYVGTFAKLLFPALRLGFMVLPPGLCDRIHPALSTTGQFPPLFLQAALADFIVEGHMSRHLKRMRRIYAGRRQFFYWICEERLSDYMQLLNAEAGIQVVGHLRKGLSDIQISEAATRLGINVSPLSKYYQHETPIQGLVLGYAACNKSQTELGIGQLERAFEEHVGVPSHS
ncbi:PLP-dependent aminotransferase family protein [Rhizobium sp. IBUN]|uniref:rhizopine catabolism transcriptional regulator MocR n=1 Tax=Rhizobium sp. IBUN TaxID=1042326 RepID=UPI0004710DAE|nr:PLP-dependent aminotransferase family protein [Rhizobium sp. IBUN]